jgi:hypothetical protein
MSWWRWYSVRSCVVSHWWPRSGDRLLDFGTWTVFSAHRVHTEWQRPLSGVHSIMMEKLSQPGEGGGCTSTSFHYINHHVQSCSVCSSWDSRYCTLPMFHLYAICTLWSSQPLFFLPPAILSSGFEPPLGSWDMCKVFFFNDLKLGVTRSRIHERKILLRFLGIILTVLRLEDSVWIS